MSGGFPGDARRPEPVVDRDAEGPEVPAEYRDAYQAAYRRSLAEHPTQLMAPARPGKRAAEQRGAIPWMSSVVVALVAKPTGRIALAAGCAVALLLLAFVAGRLVR